MSGTTLIVDEALPLLERVQSEAQARSLALVGARAVAGMVKDHLYALDGKRHRYGRHYYRQAGDSVSSGADERGGIVSISHIGFRQRLQGGTIRPRQAKLLTLPATPEAHGKRAGEFNDLDFAFAHNPKTGALQPALVRRPQTVIKYRRQRTKDGGTTFKALPVMSLLPEVLFWLVRSVEQRPDPTVLPTNRDMSVRAIEAMQSRFMRLRMRPTQEGSN